MKPSAPLCRGMKQSGVAGAPGRLSGQSTATCTKRSQVLAACERLVQVAVDWPLKRPGAPATPLCFIPLHKGADGFMSDEQFHTFYWPTLRKTLLGLIEQGMIPFLFAEGRYNTRLEAIL